MSGLSLVAVNGATLRFSAQASHCGGFSCCTAQALGTRASVIVVHGLSSCGSRALGHRLSSCGTWAYLLHSMWDLPRPALKPVSPALAGGFLTTMPPGKPSNSFLRSWFYCCFVRCLPGFPDEFRYPYRCCSQ